MFEYPEAPCPMTLPMTSERMRWCLEVIGWSRGELARRLDISETNAAKMVQGKRNIPHRVALWLESLASAHLAFPEPFFWSDNDGIGDARHAATNAEQERRREAEAAEAAYDPPARATAGQLARERIEEDLL